MNGDIVSLAVDYFTVTTWYLFHKAVADFITRSKSVEQMSDKHGICYFVWHQRRGFHGQAPKWANQVTWLLIVTQSLYLTKSFKQHLKQLATCLVNIIHLIFDFVWTTPELGVNPSLSEDLFTPFHSSDASDKQMNWIVVTQVTTTLISQCNIWNLSSMFRDICLFFVQVTKVDRVSWFFKRLSQTLGFLTPCPL